MTNVEDAAVHLLKLNYVTRSNCAAWLEEMGVSTYLEELAEAFKAVKTNSTLTTLDLHNNSIGDNGSLALAEALKINSTLATLDLGESSIDDDGTLALFRDTLFEALKTNLTLAALNLQNNSQTMELKC
ncbi:hypothetical protein BG003_009787 [Podila horticola]|nr:hypothetical protein BG003_009787 [Podila horticola]